MGEARRDLSSLAVGALLCTIDIDARLLYGYIASLRAEVAQSGICHSERRGWRCDTTRTRMISFLYYPGALGAVSASSSSLDTSHKAKSTVSVRHILIVFRNHLVSLVVVATSRASSYSRPPSCQEYIDNYKVN